MPATISVRNLRRLGRLPSLRLRPAAGAPSLTWTGPSSGTSGAAVTSYTATLSNGLGNVTVTPGDTYRGGFWSPTSAVLSPSSPSATFTYTGYGSGSRSLTLANDSLLTAPAAVPLTLSRPAGAQAIDATWLSDNAAANGGPPYILGNAFSNGGRSYSASTHYYLTAGVTTDFSAFVAAADNITLDVNGQTITYGNLASFTVANGGFESGTGSTVPNWDLSGAPSAAICNAADHWLFGAQALRFSSPSTAQIIKSDPVTLPASVVGHEVSASVTPSWGDGVSNASMTLVIDIVRASDNTVLATKSSTLFIAHGEMVVAAYTPTVAESVYVRITYTPVSNHSLDIDDVTLTASHDFGVFATDESPSSGSIVPYYNNMPAAIRTLYSNNRTNVKNFYLVNSSPGSGGVAQGAQAGYGPTALRSLSMTGSVAVSDQSVTFTGDMPNGLILGNLGVGAAAHNVTSNTFNAAGCNVSDHFGVTAMVWFTGGPTSLNSKPIYIANNTFTQAPQHGVYLSWCRGGTTCEANTFTPNIYVSDSGSFTIVASANGTVRNNTVSSNNGIFLQMDALFGTSGSTAYVTDWDIYSNTAACGMLGNREDGMIGFGRIIRIRNTQGGTPFPAIQRVKIHDNDFSYTMGIGEATVAYAIYYTQADSGTGDNLGNGVLFYNNTVKFINNYSNTANFGSCVNINKLDSGISPGFYNNVFESNDCAVYFGGYSNDTSVFGCRLAGNTIKKSTLGDQTRPFYAATAGYDAGQVSDTWLLDCVYSGGATPTVKFLGTHGSKSIGFGQTATVRVKDSGGNPVSGATVTATQAAAIGGGAATVFTGTDLPNHVYPASNNVGTTDASGLWTAAFVTDLYSGTSSATHQVLGPLHFAATSGALSGSGDATPATGGTVDLVVA